MPQSISNLEYRLRVEHLFRYGPVSDEQWDAMARCVLRASEDRSNDEDCCADPIDSDPRIIGPKVKCECGQMKYVQEGKCWDCGEGW